MKNIKINDLDDAKSNLSKYNTPDGQETGFQAVKIADNENYYISKQNKIRSTCNIFLTIIVIFLIICATVTISIHIIKKNSIKNKNEINVIKNTDEKEKIGVAFVFRSMFGNGIGRMLSLLCSELTKMDKYDIHLITGKATSNDFPLHEKVKIARLEENQTAIKEYDKTSNIKIYVLQNALTPRIIQWYKNLNGGKKVIGIMHGVFMSSIYSKQTGVYAVWDNQKEFDAYIQVIADDLYVNKRLGIENNLFIPNLYTFDPSLTPNSPLTHNNLMIMGRESDPIKGGIYGIKAMNLIRNEIPDAKLYFISANYDLENLKNLIKELNLTENIEILHYPKNISQYFLNSSALLYPSLSEASPLVMNEGKAHGVPVVAFNCTYSPPYQRGVVLVENMNYTQMAEEAVKLLKDYNYRKIKGLEAKLSLNEFSNKDTVEKWDRLFEVLVKNDSEGFFKLKNYTFERYYDEEKAREHLEYNWNKGKIYNKNLCCHDFNDMLNLTYLHLIKECKNISVCK